MKKNFIDLVVVLDKSGSMHGLTDDTIGGFNSLIEKQKEENEGQVYVTTVLFNENIEIVHNAVLINNVLPLTRQDYVSSGTTALFDAVGMAIKNEDERILKLSRSKRKLPKNTLIVVITDGYENASKNYNYDSIRKLIQQRKEQGVNFMFVGANIDSDDFAEKIGIGKDYSYTIEKSKHGIYEAMEDVSHISCCMCYHPNIKESRSELQNYIKEKKNRK